MAREEVAYFVEHVQTAILAERGRSHIQTVKVIPLHLFAVARATTILDLGTVINPGSSASPFCHLLSLLKLPCCVYYFPLFFSSPTRHA